MIREESWSGPGIAGNVFNPVLAGSGNHVITYSITDANGCSDSDQTILTVATPDATITPGGYIMRKWSDSYS